MIEKFIGLNYVKGGHDLKTGVDCWGLVICAMRDLYGIELNQHVGSMACGIELQETIEKESKNWIEVEKPKKGDVVTMCKRGSKRPEHVGLYVGKGQVLHIISEKHSSCLTPIRLINKLFSNIKYYRYDSNS